MMFFAGRPELVLPPAPDTRAIIALRWLVVCLASAVCTQVIWFFGVVMTEPRLFQSVLPLASIIVLPVILLGVCLLLSCLARNSAERRYWTPERLLQKQSLWLRFYCDGNVDIPAQIHDTQGLS
jgi:hypothetical protein